jgi:tRNA (guanine37-N1)-methyltransferase
MWIAVLTLFPEMFTAISDYGVSSRALSEQKVSLSTAISEYGVSSRALSEQKVSLSLWNPRDFTNDKHQTVDDRPFGGGPGMVMQVEPLMLALEAAKAEAQRLGKSPKVIYLSPQGSLLEQSMLKSFAEQSESKDEGNDKQDSLILIAGRYEGIDERFIAAFVDEEWSIGDYVLSGGELAAMVVIDGLVRQIPGVLGHEDSAKFDSFAQSNEGLLDCPHYTRPEEILSQKVPEVLLSGHHEKIRQWRLKQSLLRTHERRPELLERLRKQDALSEEARKVLIELGLDTNIMSKTK